MRHLFIAGDLSQAPKPHDETSAWPEPRSEYLHGLAAEIEDARRTEVANGGRFRMAFAIVSVVALILPLGAFADQVGNLGRRDDSAEIALVDDDDDDDDTGGGGGTDDDTGTGGGYDTDDDTGTDDGGYDTDDDTRGGGTNTNSPGGQHTGGPGVGTNTNTPGGADNPTPPGDGGGDETDNGDVGPAVTPAAPTPPGNEGGGGENDDTDAGRGGGNGNGNGGVNGNGGGNGNDGGNGNGNGNGGGDRGGDDTD